jgi:alpha-beta hydrolase superfamily lysophospholipase/SAM-dependent methyltransferase
MTTMTSGEHRMRLWDGTELFYRAWLPTEPTDKAMVLFHRGHEHSGRFEDVVAALGLTDMAIFAWDARGHGRSPGDRGYAPSFACMVKDVDCYVRHICQTYDKAMENILVVAHSVGAVTAATWVHDYAPQIRALVLATPALRIKLYIPFAIPGLRLLQTLRSGRKNFLKSYVKAKMLTHDPEQARAYEDDPLITREIAVNILLDVHDVSTRLIEDAGAIRVPTLLLSGGADWVVRVSAQERFFERVGSSIKKKRVFDGMYHDILHEKDRHLVIDEARRFIIESFKEATRPSPLLDADQRGYTKNEYDRLRRSLPLLSVKGINFKTQELALQTLGRLSRGVRLGWQTGFDSGQTLDYVYENRAQGSLLVGKWFDRLYLDSVGWKGIRQRKVHVEKLLGEVIGRVRDAGKPVRILDIATGCGRYVLDVIRAMGIGDLSALLRDHTPANLEAGRALADQMGLENVSFEQGDAFDEESLAGVEPSPNVAIVSGLYELFPENEGVARSLRGLARALRAGGYLIYTCQPWHPQLEMIARVLINREGRPWIMRRRTQEEMDDLVLAAGFEKVEMEIDEYGIFTVSLARIGDLS